VSGFLSWLGGRGCHEGRLRLGACSRSDLALARHWQWLRLEDKEEEGLYWSHVGSSTEGWEELAPANLNGVANRLRLDTGVRVAFDREGM
jgi:hypothetical protein